MAGGNHIVTLSPKIYIAQFDISGDANAHSISHSVELPDNLRYGDSFKARKIGLRDMQFSIAGNVDLVDGDTDQETVMLSKMAVNNVPLIITSTNTTGLGDPCEFGLVAEGQYSSEAQHGQVLKYSATGMLASRRWIKGSILWNPSTSITGTADGAEVLLGATSSTQSLYVAIAVIAFDAVSMTVKVQSDTTGFPSATDRKTFTAITDETSEMPSPVAGSITDTYYRASITAFSGTSARMIVVAGIA